MSESVHMANPTPLMERTFVAFWLALAAGSMDGFTFITANTFSTVQSGNIVQIGVWIANDDMTRLLEVSLAILAFGLGVMAMATVLKVAASRGGATSFHVLFLEAILLLLLGLSYVGGSLSPIHLAYAVSFIAGMQGGAFHRVDNMPFGDVAETLNVRLAFRHLAHWLFGEGKENLGKARIYFFMLIGFATGGIVGAFGADRIDQHALWVPGLILGSLGAIAFIESRQRVEIDPKT